MVHIVFVIAAADAMTVDKDMLMSIWASKIEVVVGDVEDPAPVVAPTPGGIFACCRATVLRPVSIRSPANRVKLI